MGIVGHCQALYPIQIVPDRTELGSAGGLIRQENCTLPNWFSTWVGKELLQYMYLSYYSMLSIGATGVHSWSHMY